ncbi:hypothetical protein, partial [Rhizobium leguminosarum]|uniref:hypothetical protein n=1 Tax=Rhizobium leguminosarum TaxID=384 RepID=UPI003F96D0E4
SVFEEQVMAALKESGYQVHPQVGIAGFFIDLSVADEQIPGRYILGIECDGAAYHDTRGPPVEAGLGHEPNASHGMR